MNFQTKCKARPFALMSHQTDQSHCVGVCQWGRARDPVADRCRHKKFAKRPLAVRTRHTTVIGESERGSCWEKQKQANSAVRGSFSRTTYPSLPVAAEWHFLQSPFWRLTPVIFFPLPEPPTRPGLPVRTGPGR